MRGEVNEHAIIVELDSGRECDECSIMLEEHICDVLGIQLKHEGSTQCLDAAQFNEIVTALRHHHTHINELNHQTFREHIDLSTRRRRSAAVYPYAE